MGARKLAVKHWKTASPKKMSARGRGVFVDKKPCSLGLEFSKEGFCTFSNDVVCLHPKSAGSELTDWCLACSHYKRIMQQMEDADNKTMDEFDEIRRTGVHPL